MTEAKNFITHFERESDQIKSIRTIRHLETIFYTGGNLVDILDYVMLNTNFPKTDSLNLKKIVEINLRCKTNLNEASIDGDFSDAKIVNLIETKIVFIRSKFEFHLEFSNLDQDFIIFIISSGGIEFNADDIAICRRGDGFAMSMHPARRATVEPGTRFCALVFRSKDGSRLIERLTGQTQKEPLSIAARFQATSSVGRALAATVSAAVAGTADEAALARSPHAGTLLQDSMIALLLENLQHNHTGRLVSRRVEQAPWSIRRAIDYILANARQDITVTDVAAAAGMSVRALQQNFQRSLGTSPQDYVKTVRLQGIRRELLDTSSRRAIEDIANAWGFANRGHFAREYRRLFGELPSQTRRLG